MENYMPLRRLFENEVDQAVGENDVSAIRDAIDTEIQLRMADIAKIREMYTDVTKAVGDSDQVKSIFIDRLSRMIHSTNDNQDSEKEEWNKPRSAEMGGIS